MLHYHLRPSVANTVLHMFRINLLLSFVYILFPISGMKITNFSPLILRVERTRQIIDVITF